MDVQAVNDSASAATLVYPTLPAAPQPAHAVGTDSNAGSREVTSAPVTPPAPTASVAPIGGFPVVDKSHADASLNDQSLTKPVAKLFNAAEADVVVSFRVEKDPDEIVTVFSDKSTGKQIVQFPSEALIALAQYFNKLAGAVLDKKA